MTKRLGMAAALCAVLAACGGSSGAGTNAASGKAFTYGDPTTYTGSGASTVASQLMSVVSNSGSPMALTSVNASTVLGSESSIAMPALTADVQATALRAAASPKDISGSFDNAATCYKETDNSATFTNCVITSNGADYTYTITINGSASLTETGANTGELKWDLALAAVYTASNGKFSLTYGYHGDLKGDRTSHIAGDVLSSISFEATSGGQTAKIGLDESLSVNLNLDEVNCSSTVVAGSTLEAKRVWTAHPSSGTWVDKAAKITWTGCGTATIQVSNA